MIAEYKKELGKSYMIFKPEEKEDLFSVQMLIENQIQGLLCFERRVFNGESEYYYDITGKHSLDSRVQRELLREKDVRELLQGLYCAVSVLHSYFLKPENILVKSEYIYLDETGVYFGYYPSEEVRDMEDILTEFAENLQEQIDYEDEGAMHLTYRFYQMIQESEKGILRILEDVLTENSIRVIREEEEWTEKEAADQNLWDEIEEQRQEKENSLKKSKPDINTLVFFLLSFLVSLCYLICVSFPENRMNVTGIIACVFVFISISGIVTAFIDIDIKKKK